MTQVQPKPITYPAAAPRPKGARLLRMYAHAIGVTNSAGTVDKFEKVIVGDDKCFIEEIRPIDTEVGKRGKLGCRQRWAA